MNINWQDVITTTLATAGGGTGLAFAAAWVIRSVITHKLTKDVELFKAQLKAGSDAEIARLKTSLQMIALEHEVMFSKLHERRAAVVAEMYERLVKLFHECYAFVNTSENSEVDALRGRYQVTANKVWECVQFIEAHEIYLPESICAQLRNFLEPLGRTVHVAGIYGRHPCDEKSPEAFTKAYEKLENEIPAAKDVLKNEFRAILGVASPGDRPAL